MSRRTVVIDYGLGNLHSVIKALRFHGSEVVVTSDPHEVESADRVVLPGVGAFADGMAGLRARSLVDPIVRWKDRERPLLGICLGMQLLLAESEEFGVHSGLALIDGRIVAIPRGTGVKVPQIGWNGIYPEREHGFAGTLLEGTPAGTMFYFVHSFTALPENDEERLAYAQYGDHRLSAAVVRGSIVGCQFHPEKSGLAGLRLFERFLQL